MTTSAIETSHPTVQPSPLLCEKICIDGVASGFICPSNSLDMPAGGNGAIWAGQPEEVANGCISLASNESSYILGHTPTTVGLSTRNVVSKENYYG